MVLLNENPKVLVSNVLKYAFYAGLLFLTLVLPNVIDMNSWWGIVIAFGLLIAIKCMQKNNPDLDFKWFGSTFVNFLKQKFNK